MEAPPPVPAAHRLRPSALPLAMATDKEGEHYKKMRVPHSFSSSSHLPQYSACSSSRLLASRPSPPALFLALSLSVVVLDLSQAVWSVWSRQFGESGLFPAPKLIASYRKPSNVSLSIVDQPDWRRARSHPEILNSVAPDTIPVS